MTDEQRQTQSRVHVGLQSGEKNPMFGKCHTDKAKQQISDKNKGRLAGEKNPSKRYDVRKKISDSKRTPEAIERNRNAILGDKNPMRRPEIAIKLTGEGNGMFGVYRYGEESGNWKGGVTPENALIRSSDKYNSWRTTIFDRDDYTCINCDQHGGYLEAHHQYNFAEKSKLRLSASNGITFCSRYHDEFHIVFGFTNNSPAQVLKFLMGVYEQ